MCIVHFLKLGNIAFFSVYLFYKVFILFKPSLFFNHILPQITIITNKKTTGIASACAIIEHIKEEIQVLVPFSIAIVSNTEILSPTGIEILLPQIKQPDIMDHKK